MSGAKLVEDVVVPFSCRVSHDPRLLQEIGAHGCPGDLQLASETNLDEFAETAAVVVSDGLGISDGLMEYRNSKHI